MFDLTLTKEQLNTASTALSNFVNLYRCSVLSTWFKKVKRLTKDALMLIDDSNCGLKIRLGKTTFDGTATMSRSNNNARLFGDISDCIEPKVISRQLQQSSTESHSHLCY
jgi:hypothetical protein